MSENSRLKLIIHRTLTPKPYNSIKIGLEYEDSGIPNMAPTEIDKKIGFLYNTLKRKLNEIEMYETERLK